MRSPASSWQLKPQHSPPDWLVDLLKTRLPHSDGRFVAQLLWQRGVTDPESVLAFLDADTYRPTSPWAFGPEMEQAIARLGRARDRQETVFVWGDFDADGITATAVLWEGLGQFFQQDRTLHYFIPNRLKESHGLSVAGLEAIAARGAQLVVTCDTGSSDFAEIDRARQLGLDLIITDHHTLPKNRPPVAAFLNSRTFPSGHPLAHLSGVAVAYKLVEALYDALPQVPHAPLEDLLDLVAIGLIADLVQLTGDCRYLAQKGLMRLKQQLHNPTRPGVAKLLELCRRTGDRPSDIAFGLGPRINAISRIHGDAREGVELLTSRDSARASVLAESAEVTNLCRKEVQQRVTREAEAQIAQLDLEANAVIVLSDPQWPAGVLGLVASQLAQTYGRPAILLSAAESSADGSRPLLRGSARSVRGIDLYGLLQQQAHLLDRFGGHPFAAGLSLPPENLPLFTASIHQYFRQTIGEWTPAALDVDLEVTLADVVRDGGASLFRELQQLEPYGMGNPAPQLLIRNAWLERRRGSWTQAAGSNKVQYKKARFMLRDESTSTLFSGVWWGHDVSELPEGRCDIVAELESGQLDRRVEYHLRLTAIRPALGDGSPSSSPSKEPWLLDWRQQAAESRYSDPVLRLDRCPDDWDELGTWALQATAQQEKLALAYPASGLSAAAFKWQQLAGLAKYLARTRDRVGFAAVRERLELGRRSLSFGLEALEAVGFPLNLEAETLGVLGQPKTLSESETTDATQAIARFLDAVAEEQFQHEYFQRAPIDQLQQTLEQRLMG
ncbi:single-stranded-DNA-specific exonuclease RecJ [Altericista sp. CCNU0014]|uniref:single-stranded-DNA-specific exonuclease RecJ n=1 Tax=Altericista sp. CCNU0014 TaxID=3082949 RepID=UPI00384B7F6B